MSGSSRITLETVITDTRACWAMSFSLTMTQQQLHGFERKTSFWHSDVRAAPIEFLPQRGEKRAAREVHQADRITAPTNRDHVSRGQITHPATVGAEDRFRLGAGHLDVDGGILAHNDRTDRKSVWANGCQRKNTCPGVNNRAAG